MPDDERERGERSNRRDREAPRTQRSAVGHDLDRLKAMIPTREERRLGSDGPAVPSQSTESPDRFARDLALVRGTLNGDPESVEWLAARLCCVPRILASLNRRIGRPLREEDIADLAQDTVIVIWEKLETFEGRGRIETWVYRFCFLSLMNRVRRRERRSRVVESGSDGLEAIAANVPPVWNRYEALEAGLEELGPPESDVIRRKHFGERTFAEISKEDGISANTVKARYYRGLAWLRRRLAPSSKGDRA